jgi:hypothetical protein
MEGLIKWSCGHKTKRRNDEHSTEFGLWVRDEEMLCSKCANLTLTNIDYLAERYDYNQLMMVEEKRYGSKLSKSQVPTFDLLKSKLRGTGISGPHLLQFSRTNPDDSEWIKWNGVYISKGQLIWNLRTLNGAVPWDTK